jgi:hypothetical protein
MPTHATPLSGGENTADMTRRMGSVDLNASFQPQINSKDMSDTTFPRLSPSNAFQQTIVYTVEDSGRPLYASPFQTTGIISADQGPFTPVFNPGSPYFSGLTTATMMPPMSPMAPMPRNVSGSDVYSPHHYTTYRDALGGRFGARTDRGDRPGQLVHGPKTSRGARPNSSPTFLPNGQQLPAYWAPPQMVYDEGMRQGAQVSASVTFVVTCLLYILGCAGSLEYASIGTVRFYQSKWRIYSVANAAYVRVFSSHHTIVQSQFCAVWVSLSFSRRTNNPLRRAYCVLSSTADRFLYAKGEAMGRDCSAKSFVGEVQKCKVPK